MVLERNALLPRVTNNIVRCVTKRTTNICPNLYAPNWGIQSAFLTLLVVPDEGDAPRGGPLPQTAHCIVRRGAGANWPAPQTGRLRRPFAPAPR